MAFMLKREAKEEYKMKNKKGLSGIVTTLIIVLLVIAAIAMIWPAIKGLLSGGTDTLSKSSACSGIEFRVVGVTNGTGLGHYDVIVERTDAGSQDVMLKTMLINTVTNNNSDLADRTEVFSALNRKSLDVGDGTFTAANKIKVIPYFVDELGKQTICETGATDQEFTII